MQKQVTVVLTIICFLTVLTACSMSNEQELVSSEELIAPSSQSSMQNVPPASAVLSEEATSSEKISQPKSSEETPREPLFNPDETDQYLHLVGMEPAQLSPDDFKLWLTTPVSKLEEIYGIMPLEIPQENDPKALEIELHLFQMYSNVQYLPVRNTLFQYNGVDVSLPPSIINIASYTDEVSGIQLGASFEEIAMQWGSANRRLYRNAYGYGGLFYQAVEYHRDGIVYSFRCMEPIYIYEDYGIDYMAMPPDNELPWNEFPQTVNRVVIALDDENEFYYKL